MHDCGLYSIEDMRPINELRMVARWKLGRALAKVERGKPFPGSATMSGEQTRFRDLLKKLDLDKSLAMEAQRIGCMPDEESGAPGEFAQLQTLDDVMAAVREQLGDAAAAALAASLGQAEAPANSSPGEELARDPSEPLN